MVCNVRRSIYHQHIALGMRSTLSLPLCHRPKLSDISVSFLPHFFSTFHPVPHGMRQVPPETPCPLPYVSLLPQVQSWAQASIYWGLSEPRKARWRPWDSNSGTRRYLAGRQKTAVNGWATIRFMDWKLRNCKAHIGLRSVRGSVSSSATHLEFTNGILC